MFAHGRLLSAAVIAASAGTALAANELQIDVNSLTTQVMPAVVESGETGSVVGLAVVSIDAEPGAEIDVGSSAGTLL